MQFKKMSKEPEETYIQRRYRKGQEVCEKMVNINSH